MRFCRLVRTGWKTLAESGKGDYSFFTSPCSKANPDLKRLRKITEQGKFKVEANDMGAVKLAREHGIPLLPVSLNIYNETTFGRIPKIRGIR